MSNDTELLRETLIRRLAHGEASVNDLPLLDNLLLCERRHYLSMGVLAGFVLFLTVTISAWLIS